VDTGPLRTRTSLPLADEASRQGFYPSTSDVSGDERASQCRSSGLQGRDSVGRPRPLGTFCDDRRADISSALRGLPVGARAGLLAARGNRAPSRGVSLDVTTELPRQPERRDGRMGRRIWVVLAIGALVAALLPAGWASAGGFCSGYENERLTDARGVRVAMTDFCFTPTVLRVREGATVTFVNKDPEAHTVGGAAGSFGDMHREIAPGKSVSFRFEREGIFPYVCLIHPGMAGAIVVGDGIGPAALAGTAASQVEAPPRRAESPQSTSASLWGGIGIAAAVGLALAAGLWGLLWARRRAPRGDTERA
jgi:plastocyanin